MKRFILGALLLLAGCDPRLYYHPPTGPEPPPFHATVKGDPWRSLVTNLALANLRLRLSDRDGGLLVTEEAAVPGSFLDCGDYGGKKKATEYVWTDCTVALTIQIQPAAEPGFYEVTIVPNVAGVYQDATMNRPHRLTCHSTGLLEKMLLEGLL